MIFNESNVKKNNEGLFKGATKASDANVLFARVLQYLECPQYLRKYFFPVHQDLKYAGIFIYISFLSFIQFFLTVNIFPYKILYSVNIYCLPSFMRFLYQGGEPSCGMTLYILYRMCMNIINIIFAEILSSKCSVFL